MRDRRLRKTGRPPPYRPPNDFDPESTPQYFQVSVNVLEARKLTWSNPQATNSYVMVVLGRKKHRTTVRKNMDEPLYREYLVFDMYMSIREIQRSSLWLAVMEPKCCAPPRMLGEATIDLGAIWAQPNHQVYHKWAQLSLPRDPQSTGPVGFLKVDISIIFKGEVQVMPAIVSDDKVEDTLILPTSAEQQKACYQVTVHAAFSLPSCVPSHLDRRYGKAPSTYVRVSFCGLVAKTNVQHRTNDPKYNEQISMVEMFPNMNQTIRFEVCSADGCFNRVLGSAELKLAQISHDGENGFLPTFGPSLLHMYGPNSSNSGTSSEDGPHHKGMLLITLKTIVPYYQAVIRTVIVEPVAPLHQDSLWILEDFCIYCPIFEISMLDRRICGKLTGLAITTGEMPADRRVDDDFFTLITQLKNRKLHYTGSLDVIKTKPAYGYIEFPQEFPVLQLASCLPDFRFRMYRNNIVYGIVSDLEQSLTEVEKRLNHFEYTSPNELMDDLNKAVDDAAGNILKYLDIVQYSSNSSTCEEARQQYTTELDQKQLALQKEEIEKIYHQITRKNKIDSTLNIFQHSSRIGTRDSLIGSRKGVKIMLAETKCLVQSLRTTINKTTDGWPDVVIWLLNEGSRVAYIKVPASEIIYSVIPEQCGSSCGRLQTIYMKPLKCLKHSSASSPNCICIAAKVEILMWMGLFRQRHAFGSCLPVGYFLKTKRDFEMYVKSIAVMVECRAFIYRAKLTNEGGDNLNSMFNSFVRINAMGDVRDTKVQIKTSSPIWNQVLKTQKMVHTSPERLDINPPYVLVEVYNDDQNGRTDLIGRFQIQPVVDDRVGYAPRLQWYEIYRGSQHTGQILMSIQLLQVPEKVLKSTDYSSVTESFFAAGVKDDNDLGLDDVIPLPKILIPKSASYKVDVYWWGLRDMNITRKPCVILEIDEIFIKSDVIGERKCNSNFPNGRASQIFELPLNDEYCPTLSVRLYDSSTFGRTLFLGTNTIKNPSKYIVEWLPKKERIASLKSVSIVSSDFCEVGGQMLYIKKSSKFEDCEEFVCNTPHRNAIIRYAKIRRWKWASFCKNEPSEEEITLLPVYAKENNQIKVVKKIPKPTECNDWWMRFFQSEKTNYEEEKFTSDYITIYDYELEYQPEFFKFKDWCSTLKFYNGKKTGIPERDEQLQCGALKVGVAIYKWPPPENTVAVSLNGVELDKGYFLEHPCNEASKYLVRVYVVRGLSLPMDIFGKSDPYVIMNCGKKHLGDRKNYVPNTTDPIFGKLYEFSCTLPDDYLLSISLYGYDTMPPDELIGTTTIDLEDRVYSKHRARVGLATEYNLSGVAKWRDNVKPSAILEELCYKNHIPLPLYPDSFSVIVNGVEYKDKGTGSISERKENICLSILHKWQTLPICGYQLVPEHVETRTLYHPDKPGLERGKIQMWVDIFPMDANTYIPPPSDITPRKVEEYELRVIVWDVQSLLIHMDKKRTWKTADLYVKIWIGSIERAQQTDIHHNSLSGEGNFNWRMVFNFLYHHAKRKLINKEKCPFTEYEEYVAPILEVQLVESNEDEFLGSLSLNLNSMYRGSKLAQDCTLSAMETGKKINLFSVRSIRAWWPIKTNDLNTGEDLPAGFIDMEMTLLPREKATLMPVGVGRDPPVPLPEPSRPKPPNDKCKRYYDFFHDMCVSRSKEVLIFFLIVSVVWFVAYLLYLAVPSAETFFLRSVPA
ncbi:otoferlin-like [Pectinophora gossypiella]|uniref:otoferlin-like n=1 Tax=Pectinophora gossypiella TaxID=13191 RepID=UPI00214F576E|nr:otoferlin-like [Pectinophora gossypiella]